jgi:hypothetical protein
MTERHRSSLPSLSRLLGRCDEQPGEKDTEGSASIDVQRSFILSSGGITNGSCWAGQI